MDNRRTPQSCEGWAPPATDIAAWTAALGISPRATHRATHGASRWATPWAARGTAQGVAHSLVSHTTHWATEWTTRVVAGRVTRRAAEGILPSDSRGMHYGLGLYLRRAALIWSASRFDIRRTPVPRLPVNLMAHPLCMTSMHLSLSAKPALSPTAVVRPCPAHGTTPSTCRPHRCPEHAPSAAGDFGMLVA